MKKIHFRSIFIPLVLVYSLPLSLSDYEIPNKYFVNCGSRSSVPVNDRNFVGDTFSVGRSKSITDKNPAATATTSLLYQTARIYRHQSSYEFEITENGTHFIRLHFFVFKSRNTNLSDALFNVSTSKSSLLSNFSVRNSSYSPVIEEFLLTINASKFNIYFTPVKPSFAFVNAIEIFFAPNLTKDGAIGITSEGKSVTYSGLLSHALQTIHRINVGGQTRNDSLWRSWISDDHYIYVNGLVTNCDPANGKLDYELKEEGNKFIAPEFVYNTCKKLEEQNKTASVTWRFDVKKNAIHLVRVHFCDIGDPNTTNDFRLLIDNKFSFSVNPYIDNAKPAVPFYHDFVVDSDDSGVLKVGMGIGENSVVKKAYLNGIEIMELMKETGLILEEPKDHRPVIIIGSVCSVASVICLVVVVLLGFKCKKGKLLQYVASSHVGRWISLSRMTRKALSFSSLPNCNLKLKMTLAELLYATHGFDDKLLIGEGGFGKVYKGVLKSGLKVAVKRSDPKHGQGLPEFQTEIIILSKIRHRHLVSLIGYCNEGLEMILVYEFMENGTLRDHLYNSENGDSSPTRPKLHWNQRLEICIGAATGLHYLHSGSDGGIIHRDVKSTNILLNEHFIAKVADFGLSKSGPIDPDHFSIGIKGSFGYLDPEYLTSLQFTDKSDVYSFGVVLLEVLCGRPAIINSQRIEEVNLAEWGMFWQHKGQLETIVDPSLVSEISPNSLRKFGETVEKCLKKNGVDRPTMLDVLWDLEYALQLQKAEVPRGLPEESGTEAFLELPFGGSFPSHTIPEEEDDLLLIEQSSTSVL